MLCSEMPVLEIPDMLLKMHGAARILHADAGGKGTLAITGGSPSKHS
jgi:hypothetical protein